MKYAEWKRRATALRALQDAEHERRRNSAVVVEERALELRREYVIGRYHSGRRTDEASVTVAGSAGYEGRPGITFLRTRYGTGQLGDLTHEEFVKIAEIVQMLEAWEMGEIDDILPSGDWKGWKP